MSDATILFRDVLQSVYGLLDLRPVPGGDIHRFHMAATPKLCPEKKPSRRAAKQKGPADE